MLCGFCIDACMLVPLIVCDCSLVLMKGGMMCGHTLVSYGFVLLPDSISLLQLNGAFWVFHRF